MHSETSNLCVDDIELEKIDELRDAIDVGLHRGLSLSNHTRRQTIVLVLGGNQASCPQQDSAPETRSQVNKDLA